MTVRPVEAGDLDEVTRVLTDSWGGRTVVAHGEEVDAGALPGFIAHENGELAGLITYRMTEERWEIITIDAVIPGRGVAAKLLDNVANKAKAAGVRSLWLVTTNDNTHALRFHQRYGFDLVALHRFAIDAARAIKPGIPATADGIPIRHELELQLDLPGS